MNILTYRRVSTEDQHLLPQDMEISAWAVKNGATVVGEYQDVMSGTKCRRDGLDQLLAHAAGQSDPPIEAVVVVKLDRLGRSLINVLELIRTLDRMGVAIICTSQGIDTRQSNPCGRMMVQLMAVFAEFERSLISERTKAGMAVVKAKGKKLGKPSPYLVHNWLQVLKGWQERTGGFGLRELARELGGVSTCTAARLNRENPL